MQVKMLLKCVIGMTGRACASVQVCLLIFEISILSTKYYKVITLSIFSNIDKNLRKYVSSV